jgi:hypothetical protein
MIEADRDDYLEFVHTDEFTDSVDGLLTEAEVHRLENQLLADPEVGQLVSGTGGVRKMSFALEGRGKSGGIRVLYVYSMRETLTQGEKNALKKWVQQLQEQNGPGN